MARQRRLRDGFEALSDGGRVIDAQTDARFESASAFRLAFAGILGCPPGHLKPNAVMLADWVTTPLGDMIAVCSASHLHLLEFVERRALQRRHHVYQCRVYAACERATCVHCACSVRAACVQCVCSACSNTRATHMR